MDSSVTSTACSSPNNESLEKIIKNDTVRYVRKGYGLIMAMVIAITFFTIAPQLLWRIYPSMIAGMSEKWLTITSISLLHIVTNLICYIATYFIYTAKSPFLERYKVLSKAWPWESHPEEWKKLLKDSIKLLCINQLIVSPALLTFDVHVSGVDVRTDPETMPSIKEIVLQICVCMVVEDFCFYWGHRLLHHPRLYPHIHKIHHRYTHTVSIANEHAHPLEFVLSNALPTFMGSKLLGKQMHIVTLWMWLILRITESVDGHCGYEFSWSPFRLLPLSGSSIYHNFHHSAIIGNYGSFFTIWDTICKTNHHYFVWLSKRQRSSQFGEIKNAYNDFKKKLQADPNTKAAQLNESKKEPISDSSATKIPTGHHQKAE